MTGLSKRSVADDAELQVLLADYVSTREEEYNYRSTLVGVIGLGVTVMIALIGVTSQSCQPSQKNFLKWLLPTGTGASCTADVLSLSPYVLAAAPALPALVTTIMLTRSMQSTVRSRYLRTLEARIRSLVGANNESEWYPAGLTTMLHQINGGGSRWSFRLLYVMQWLPASLVALGTWLFMVAYIGDHWLQWVALGGWGFIALLCVFAQTYHYLYLSDRWGSFLAEQKREFRRTEMEFPPGSGVIWSRVVFPRFAELVKIFFHLAGFLVAWAAFADRQPLLGAGMSWLAFEVLIYQGRYILNDLRDMDSDRDHVSAAVRNRLPATRQGVRTGLTGLIVRGVTLAVLFVVAHGALRWFLAVGLVVTVVSTFLYEGGKLLQTKEDNSRWPVIGTAVVLASVGTGYAFRIGSGVYSGGGDVLAIAGAAAFGYGVGTLTVFYSWGLESYCDDNLPSKKNHVYWIGNSLLSMGPGWKVEASKPIGDVDDSKPEEKRKLAEAERKQVRVFAQQPDWLRPTSAAHLLGLAGAGWFAVAGTHGSGRATLVAVGGSALMLLVSVRVQRRCVISYSQVASQSLMVWVAIAIIGGWGSLEGTARLGAIALPLLISELAYVHFRLARYDDINIDFHKLFKGLAGKWTALSAAFVRVTIGPTALSMLAAVEETPDNLDVH